MASKMAKIIENWCKTSVEVIYYDFVQEKTTPKNCQKF